METRIITSIISILFLFGICIGGMYLFAVQEKQKRLDPLGLAAYQSNTNIYVLECKECGFKHSYDDSDFDYLFDMHRLYCKQNNIDDSDSPYYICPNCGELTFDIIEYQ